MGDKHNGGKRPKLKASKDGAEFDRATAKTNYDAEHPKFCLRYLQGDFDTKSLPPDKQSAMLTQMQSLANIPWKEIKTSNHKGLGTEFIPVGQIYPPVPRLFKDEERFMFFRYCGNLPMGGIRIRDIFHVLWIEKQFGEVYDHD